MKNHYRNESLKKCLATELRALNCRGRDVQTMNFFNFTHIFMETKSTSSKQGRTCSVVRQTKLLVRQYVLPENGPPWGRNVLADLVGPSDQYGPFS